jgi:urease accessory protein
MRKRRLSPLLLRLAVLPLWAAGQAMAHHLPPGMEEVDEFADEAFSMALTHPLTGMDHWLAAVAVGLTVWVWGKKTGFQSTALFVLLMAVGTIVGRAGLQLPLMETGLAVSVILAGCVIAGAKWFSSRAVLSIAALTGAWHGIAHGLEMPAAAPVGLYTLGLTMGSGLIALAAGLLATRLPDVQEKPALPRWAGRGLAALGTALLVTSFAS